ncbi:hypothetical protein BO83DRAFT_227955 [Aspergillus eucalypticola CBS 122712]|uniref:Uncharacterized protein n=1 Tax=Aspergillus eucalypticola (strain CBS 122712 / IBT 29274) TaxID=1448314 RepID=A0A317VX29_ASPEC|nr:uncharacterized protein BO83DRAFT_227955 [Aspergillus eucalypticola CBS 122712]PWY77871.1 hypothetical protein BO83DRAFT_227955 [Aspergillus eucalypticola CBS 122712]
MFIFDLTRFRDHALHLNTWNKHRISSFSTLMLSSLQVVFSSMCCSCHRYDPRLQPSCHCLTSEIPADAIESHAHILHDSEVQHQFISTYTARNNEDHLVEDIRATKYDWLKLLYWNSFRGIMVPCLVSTALKLVLQIQKLHEALGAGFPFSISIQRKSIHGV